MRFRYCFLHRGPTQIIRALRMLPICHFSSPKMCPTNKTQENFPKVFDRQRSKLNHQVVHSTLLNCPSDLIALRFFLWCAGQHNFFHNKIVIDHMVGVIKHLMGTYGFTPNTFARNIIIDALFKIGHTRRPNFFTFNIALCNLCNLNDLYHIGDAFRMMLRWRYHPKVETFEMILSCLCKMGKIVEAHQVLGLLITLGIAVSVTVWSMLMNGFCRLQRLDVAGKLLEKMVETGSSPSIVTYTTLIRGFLKSNMVSEAFNILNIMESKGYAPDLLLCNVLIDSFAKLLGGVMMPLMFSLACDHGTWLLILLLSLHYYPPCVCLGGLICYPSWFMGYARQEELTKQLMRIIGFSRVFPGQDAYIHTVVMDGLIKVRKFNAAIKVFRKVVEEGYTLDAAAYTVAIIGLFMGGRAGEAWSLYTQMKEVSLALTVHTYNVMVSGFVKERDLNMVNLMLQEMIEAKVELSSNTFLRLSKFLCRPYHSNSVIELWIEMTSLGLISSKVVQELLSDEVAEGMKVDDGLIAFSDITSETDLSVETSGSEDVYDVAASMA
ncbi:pentatricopeptide repeat-containing protein [Pyrus ussuriensis x Pyrus communis]|uniref:Pentatricopeptide repeat-containing protein n=1 Tax=Pyrus ussuriensis x Pyrus communis TaxID=2448454 RepID=A0A5N5G6S0_9ROSA|nr:pentatricopeptide repeat-containing protein [Pyrus ussuriensis x Pyrus communis]